MQCKPTYCLLSIWRLALLVTMITGVAFSESGGQYGSLDPQRVNQIARMLNDTPTYFGRPIHDRTYWDSLAATESGKRIIRKAEKLVTTALPETSDDLYLEFSRTGRRVGWEGAIFNLHGRVGAYALAECLENQGRFLKPFHDIVQQVCNERTWVLPAHDKKLDNFYDRQVSIDLFSSQLAWVLATCDLVLADKMNSELRQRVRSRIHYFVIDPFRNMVLGKQKENFWLRTLNNWNAVCLSNVLGASLPLLDDRMDRALFLGAAEYYSQFYLKGYAADGYCSEGVGYWNYGFGHYIYLSELVYQATHGQVDLYRRPKVRSIARYGHEIEIAQGIYPSFADCPPGAQPNPILMNFISRRFHFGWQRWEAVNVADDCDGSIPTWLMFMSATFDDRKVSSGSSDNGSRIRSWFPESQVLICRPAGSSVLAVAIKGGNNNEHHNHNDVGSFILINDNVPLLVDPGSETYTQRTFSKQRYESNVLNSFGHSVPVVAGKLQSKGAKARAIVMEQAVSPEVDFLRLDISSAYNVPELKTLERTFVYDRRGKGTFTVTDTVAYTSPQTFEVGLITFGNYKQVAPDILVVFERDKAIRIQIDSQQIPFEIHAETIKEDLHGHTLPTRLGIRLSQPETAATVTTQITPIPLSDIE